MVFPRARLTLFPAPEHNGDYMSTAIPTRPTERAPGTSSRPTPREIPLWLPGLIGAVAALAVFAITLGGSYFYDDMILKEDPRFSHVALWPKFWTQDYMPNAIDRLYRPLTSMSFAVEYYLHGDRPWVYHLVNILLHAGAAAAVAELARRLTQSTNTGSVGSASSLGIFRGAALPGGVFVPKTAVGHPAEARCHEKFSSSSRAILPPLEKAVRSADPTKSESARSLRIACAAGVLFAVHPIHVEAVAGLVGRAELLCTLATIIGLILFLKPMTGLRATAIVVCAIVALLSKEQGILFPAVLLAMTPCRRQILNIHSTSDNVKTERGAMGILTASISLITAAYLIFRERLLGFEWNRTFLDWAVNPLVRSEGSDRILMPLTLLGRYVALLVAPTKLSLDYGARVIGWTVNWHEPYVFIGAVALVIWFLAAIWSVRARQWAVFLCLLALAISYGIVSNAFILIGTIFGERLMYMPSAFFLILVAALLDHLLRPRFFAAIILILAALGAGRAFTYARLCDDPPALYLANLRDRPNSMSLHGLVENQYMLAGKYREARAIGQDCLDRLPDCWQSYQMCVEPDLKLHDFADAERVLSHVDRRCPPVMIAPLWARLKFERDKFESQAPCLIKSNHFAAGAAVVVSSVAAGACKFEPRCNCPTVCSRSTCSILTRTASPGRTSAPLK